MSIEAMKRALKTFEKIHEGCAFVKEDDLHKDAKDLATYVQEDCEFTMKTLRQAIEQAEKESTLQEISDIGQEIQQEPYADKANQLNSDRMKIDPVTGNVSIGTPQAKQWDTSDMAYRPGGLSVEQEKLCKYCGGIGRVVCDGRCCMPEQEPSTWAETNDLVCALLRQAHDVLACASYPFKHPWVGLTEEEIDAAKDVAPPNLGGEYYREDVEKIARAIEAKLKEKNNE